MVRMGTVRQGLPWAQSLRPGLHQTRRTNADTKRARFSARALPSEPFTSVGVTRLASSETDVPLLHPIEITQWVNVQGHQPNPRYSSAVRFQ